MYNQKSKDVAADESTNGSTLDYGEASLPAVEEARASVHLKGNERSNYTKVTTKLLYGGIALFFLVLVVVLPVTIVTVRKNNSSSSSSSASAVRQSSVDAVTAYMVAQKVSDPSTFQDTQSAQYKAAQWLAETDGANLPVPTTSIAADSKAYRYMFRYVMALNYYALGGPAWTRQMNFLSDLDVCLWQSSTVDLNKPIPDGTGTQPIPQSEAKTDEDEIIGVFCVSSDPEQKPHSLYIGKSER